MKNGQVLRMLAKQRFSWEVVMFVNDISNNSVG